jgi:hypothetical protein
LTQQGGWDQLRRDLIALSQRSNVFLDGFCALSEYLLAVGVKQAS